MEKLCTVCGEPYFARWRNDPADPHRRCPICRGSVAFCAHCGIVISQWPSTDPRQLALWEPLHVPKPRIDRGEEIEFWYTMRERATLEERRKYPYQ